jgi:hypothetical protein
VIIIPPGSDVPLRGDLLVRAVLRSDLTPIPQTLELEVRSGPESAALQVGAVLRAGRELTPFRIIKESGSGPSGRVTAGRSIEVRGFVCLIDSCAPVADPRTRAVVAYGASLGGLYRSCGARVTVENDVQVPVFACLKGHVPTFSIAQALQEAAGAIVVTGAARVAFRRLADLITADPVRDLAEDVGEAVESGFVERHAIPATFSTDSAGAYLYGGENSGRGVLYRPGASQATLNSLGSALVTRRKIRSIFAPDIVAGDVLSVAGARHVVVTAAHVFEAGGGGIIREQASTFWLAQVVR